MNEHLNLNEEQRIKLKKMLKVLFPEYKHVTVGADYVSLSQEKAYSLQMNWDRQHWFVLLAGETLKRLYILGRRDQEWLKDVTSLMVLAVMYPKAQHPVDIIYGQFELIIQELKDKNTTQFQVA